MSDDILDPVLVAAQSSLSLCERECAYLRQKLAESEAGAAVIRCAAHVVWEKRETGCTAIPIGEFALLLRMIRNESAGRDFLSAAQKCRTALLEAKAEIESCIESPENHDLGTIDEAIAEIENYL